MRNYIAQRLGHPILWICVLSILGNITLGYQYWQNQKEDRTTAQLFPLLSPRIFAEGQNDILINFLPLREQIQTIVSQYGDTFGLYFEYLPSGTSIGIHEKEGFYGASLVKVPVVMAYFRQKEVTGLSLDKAMIRLEKRDIDPSFGELWKKGVGYQISYEEAVRKALVDSDNTAALVLANRVLQAYFDDVYVGLDIDFTKKDGRIIISPKQYASILKALYLSSVLSKDSSSAILTLLTQTKFNDKLPAGVPPGIPVAHKTGTYEDKQIYQDCGIVYVPKRPYILCMVSQSTEDEARTRMSALSKTVYEFVVGANHVRK